MTCTTSVLANTDSMSQKHIIDDSAISRPIKRRNVNYIVDATNLHISNHLSVWIGAVGHGKYLSSLQNQHVQDLNCSDIWVKALLKGKALRWICFGGVGHRWGWSAAAVRKLCGFLNLLKWATESRAAVASLGTLCSMRNSARPAWDAPLPTVAAVSPTVTPFRWPLN